MGRMSGRAALLVPGVLAGILAWGELTQWRASRLGLGDGPRPGPHEAVVVLGFGNRGPRANLVNRYRVRAGLRSRQPSLTTGDASSVLVLCGGAVHGDVPESQVLARYARELGYAGPVALDTASTTTWENIVHAIPLIEDADRIKIVSDAVHAHKGRVFLRRQRPDLADRVVRGEEYRFGELFWLKPAMSAVGLYKRHLRPARPRRPGPAR